MQGEDDILGLSKVVAFIRATSILILLLNIYWYCHSWLGGFGLTASAIDRILINFNTYTGFFSRSIYTQSTCIFLLLLSCYGSRKVENPRITLWHIWIVGLTGLVFFFGSNAILAWDATVNIRCTLYCLSVLIGYICALTAATWIGRLIGKSSLSKDPFNRENESFQQEDKLIENEYSINLPTQYYFQKRWHKGWVNIVNPFRATAVLGTPGSGKSYAVITPFIKQTIEKGYALYLYDFKFPDLSIIAYNHLRTRLEGYKVKPKFYVLNFDNPRLSHRCNPIAPEFMTDVSDAYESAFAIMLNLNRTWITKRGDFFVESPIILLAAIIWYLKIYRDGRYCTFPHAIELLNKPYSKVFAILSSYPQLENYMSPFIDAMNSGAQDQLQGQLASAKIPLSRMVSPQLYWVMTGNDFSLDINNPEAPKVLCIGSNPDRQTIYSAALGLYNSRITRLVNQKNKHKSAIVIDELPTLYFRDLDNLIATARSNKVAMCLGIQDFSQLERDYGSGEAKVIQNIVGNIIAGQVVGDSARILSERFGRIVQQRSSVTVSPEQRSTSTNEQLDQLIPASTISNLSQGMFVGSVTDNFAEPIEQKVFNARIIIDNQQVKTQTAGYVPIPQITDFRDSEGGDRMEEIIQNNFRRIKREVNELVAAELKEMGRKK